MKLSNLQVDCIEKTIKCSVRARQGKEGSACVIRRASKMEYKKLAVVTGGGAGIGKAIALKLAKEGYSIGICDIRLEVLEAVKNEIEALGACCETTVCDVTNKEQVTAAMEGFHNAFGRIDVLVNNAGICPLHTFNDITYESFTKTFQINVISMILCSQVVVGYMKAQGGGKIINACSQSGFRETASTIEYGSTKWAIRGMTRCMAVALAPDNINVNAYCPGTVWTEMQDHIVAQVIERNPSLTKEQYQASVTNNIPLHRFQTMEDIANLVYYFASPAGDNVTGQCWMVNGGQVMC